MKEKIIKSKQRVKDFAEVFTPEHIVKDMCDLIPDDVWNTIERAKEIVREYETQNKRFAEHRKTVSGIVEAFALSLVKHAIAEQVTGHDGVSAEYIAQKAKEYILQNREVTQ